MPDIRFFDRGANIGKYFARFDYMGVHPTLLACQGFLTFCDDCRKTGFKLPKQALDDELRAYTSIKNNEYVTTNYWWQVAR